MIIQTKYLGKIEVDKEKVIYFEEGLPGFVDERQFVLLHLPGNEVFQTMQSVNNPHLAFIVTSPYHFYESYEVKLDDSIIQKLKIKQEEEVAIYTIVTLKDPFHTSTINVKAPLVINLTNQLGKQYILNDEEYSTKAPIVSIKANYGEGAESCSY
mgnify:CR=1 FL=1